MPRSVCPPHHPCHRPLDPGPFAPPIAAPPALSPVPPRPGPEPAAPESTAPPAPSLPPSAPKRAPPVWAWADLMRRMFAIDVLACAGCGGRLRLLATIEDPTTVTKILAHLGLPTEAPAVTPARSPPQPDGFDFLT